MVHALEEIRRLLSSAGVLIDMHPAAEFPSIEINQGGKIDVAGDLLVRQWIDDYQHTDSALAESLRLGLYVVERESVYDCLTYFDSVEEMRTILKASFDESAREAEAAGEEVSQVELLAVRADDLMQKAGSGAELRMHERIHISRLRPT